MKNQKHTLVANPRVLVLNVAYMPIDVIAWNDAMNLWATGKAQILHTYENTDLRVRSAVNDEGERKVDFVCPSVIYLQDAKVNYKTLVNVRPLNRRSLYDTYKGICCYCGQHVSLDEFTIEHVIPKSKGGLDCWENLSIACKMCNSYKGDRDLEQTSLKLQYKLGVPTTSHHIPKSIAAKVGASIPSESWRQYITWSIEVV